MESRVWTLTLPLVLWKLNEFSRLTCKSYEYLKSQLDPTDTPERQQEQINPLCAALNNSFFLNVHQPPAARRRGKNMLGLAKSCVPLPVTTPPKVELLPLRGMSPVNRSKRRSALGANRHLVRSVSHFGEEKQNPGSCERLSKLNPAGACGASV